MKILLRQLFLRTKTFELYLFYFLEHKFIFYHHQSNHQFESSCFVVFDCELQSLKSKEYQFLENLKHYRINFILK